MANDKYPVTTEQLSYGYTSWLRLCVICYM